MTGFHHLPILHIKLLVVLRIIPKKQIEFLDCHFIVDGGPTNILHTIDCNNGKDLKPSQVPERQGKDLRGQRGKCNTSLLSLGVGFS